MDEFKFLEKKKQAKNIMAPEAIYFQAFIKTPLNLIYFFIKINITKVTIISAITVEIAAP